MEKHTLEVARTITAWVQAVFFTLLFSNIAWVPYAHAGPEGGTVTGGSGSISQSGNQTTINQNSQIMAIDWQSYNLGSDERVQYIQPNSSSLSLNRILSNGPSSISGRIDANGQIILINPNGVFFTSTSVINVGGIVASGLDMTPTDFMNGNYIFNEVQGTSGLVVNGGIIKASTGGNVTLLGKQIRNDGLIVAKLGSVNLAAGKEAVLTFDNTRLIGIGISKAILQDELGVDPAVLNSGTINAEGGKVLLTASVSRDIFSQVLDVEAIRASSVVVNDDGSYTLGGGADVVNTGTVDVSSYSANANDPNVMRIVLLGDNVTSSGTLKADNANGNGGEIELHARDTTLLTENSVTSTRSEANGKGGTVKVLGDIVGVTDQSTIDASGANGGGEILIGGDFQGKNDHIRNASITYVSTDSTLYADALVNGNGGKIINWADDTTGFYGTAYARGGVEAGDGGLVEISGKMSLSFNGWVDTSAANGTAGTLLFDPQNIIIHDAADGPQARDGGLPSLTGGGGTFDISETALEALSATANIVLQADNDITINDLADNELSLQTGSGYSISIFTDFDNSGSGDFIMQDTADIIRTQGGAVDINAASMIVGNINTTGAAGSDGGTIALTTRSGSMSLQSLTSSGGAATTNGFNAGNIRLLTGDNNGTNDRITINGNITANGSDAVAGNLGGNAGQMLISTGNTTGGEDRVNLNGDISAQGGNSTVAANIGLNNNIQIDTPELRTTGNRTITTARSRSDGNINSTDIYIRDLRSGNDFLTDLQLGGSLTVTAGASDRVRFIANVDYDGIAASSSLSLNAGDDITLYEISDSNIGTADSLNISLNADQDGNSVGDVTLGELAGDNSYAINTGGGTYNVSGDNYIGGSTTGGDATRKTVNTGSNDITLNMTGTATLGEIRARNLSVTARAANANATSIGTGTSGDDIILTGQANLTSNLGRINLVNSNNDFTTITVNSAGNVDLLDSNGAVGIQGSITGDLNLTSTEADTPVTVITNSGALSVSANSVFTAESGHSISLSSTSNNFTGNVTFTGNGGNLNSVTVFDSSDITLQDNFNLDGDLTVAAANITLRDTTVGGHLDLDAVTQILQASGKRVTVNNTTTLDGTIITLANNNNDFQGAVNVNNASAAVTLRDSAGGIQLGGATPFVSSSLNVRADGGDITQGNTITTGATILTVDTGQSIYLGNTGNTFSSTVSYTGTGGNINNLTIADSTVLTIQDGLTLDGDLTATASQLTLGNLTVGADGTGNLTATSTTGQINELNDTSRIIVADITDLDGGTGGILLDNLNHDFQGEVRLQTTGGDVSIRDANTLELGLSNIDGGLTAQANTITQVDGAGVDGMTVTGLSTFIVAENSDITLNNVDNQFNSIAFSAPLASQYLGRVSVTNNGDLDLQSIRVTNNLTARSVNGDITNSGALIVGGNTNINAVNIDLGHLENDFNTMTVNVTAPATGDAIIHDIDTIEFSGTSSVNDLTVTTTTGDIIDTNGAGHSITSSGVASFTAAQDVMLDSGNHNFNELQLVSGRDATVNAVSIADLGASNVTANLDIETDGNIVNNSGALIVGGAATFIAANGGNIELNHANNELSGTINLASSAASGTLGNVAINNSLATDVSMDPTTVLSIENDIDITSGGEITSSSALVVKGVTTLSASGQAINLLNAANDFHILNVEAANSVDIWDTNGIEIGTINANTVNVDAGQIALGLVTATTTALTARNGQISDANVGALNIVGDTASLSAIDGVGVGDPLETQLANLTVINTAGEIGIQNTGDVTVDMSTSGNIDFSNSGDVYINLIDAIANGDTHSLTELTVVNGSVFGAQPQTLPDIRGHDVTVIVNDGAGDFGNVDRPIYLDVHGVFTLLANVSAYDFYGGIPSDIVDNSSIKLSISTLFSLLSGQKLIEVESLADLDPAVFTEVRNYYYDDLAIMMPLDQMYSDEEEEERHRKMSEK